jgi:hypothetical protein
MRLIGFMGGLVRLTGFVINLVDRSILATKGGHERRGPQSKSGLKGAETCHLDANDEKRQKSLMKS